MMFVTKASERGGNIQYPVMKNVCKKRRQRQYPDLKNIFKKGKREGWGSSTGTWLKRQGIISLKAVYRWGLALLIF